MKNFKKPSFGGGNFNNGDRGDRRGQSFGNRRSFGGDRGGFGGRDGGFAPKEMFEATCASCSKTCEVPFRPTGERPVYCRECFDGNKPESRDREYAPRREFSRPTQTDRVAQTPNTDTVGIKKQLDTLTTKLDRIITILESKSHSSISETEPAPKIDKKVVTKKKVVSKKK